MKWNIDDIPIFLAIIEHKGITAAADRLNMPKSTVSRTLSRLESDMNIRLFERTTRQLQLTPEGASFAPYAQAIMDQAAKAEQALSGKPIAPRGILKIALPVTFSREIIGSKWHDFTTAYPDITLQITLTSYDVNLRRDEFDIAVIEGPVTDHSLDVTELISTPLIWVSSPYYKRQFHFDDTVSSLKSHIRYIEPQYCTSKLSFKTPSGRQYIDTSKLMSINDVSALRDLTLQGDGVALLPELYCLPHLKRGDLVELCPEVIAEAQLDVRAITPQKDRRSTKAELCLQFITDCLADYRDIR